MKYRIESDFKVRNELPISEIRNIEVDILRQFVEFCDKHGLKYFLAGGTLIGAVRHQGFVPWDDDMDVSMPRPDFEKFRELTKNGRLGDYEIRSIIHTPDLHVRPFDRLVDTRYMAKTKLEQKFIPPWLDIHALDGLPTDEKENFEHWNEVAKLKKGSKESRTPISQTKGRLRRIKRWIKTYKYRKVGPVKYAEDLIALGKKYSFEDAEYIAAFVAGYGRKERMPKAWFMDGDKKLYFEGIHCSVPPHYDKVLKHMYGNYLQLPPSKKRATHVVKLYEVFPKEKGDDK